MSDFEPFSEDFINTLSPYMRSIANIENLIFDFTEEQIPEIIEEISKIDENTQQIFYHTIICASDARPKQANNLFLLWTQMKEAQITFHVNDFTYYLKKKGAHINLNSSVLRYAPIIEDMEEIYAPNTIEYIIMNDDLDQVVFQSSKDDFFQQKCSFGTERISLLNLAAYYGSSKVFMYMQLNGCKFDISTPSYAIKGGNEEIIEMCAKNGCSFDNTLNICIQYHRNNFLGWLLENYFDIESPAAALVLPNFDLNSCMLFHNTLAYCYFSKNYPPDLLVQLSQEAILSSGNLELIHAYKETNPTIDRVALSFVVSNGYLYVLKEFDSFIKTKARISFLMNAATLTSQSAIIQYVVGKGANTNIVDEEGYTPLMRLSFLGNLSDVKFLVESGANINYVPKKGMTALCCACLSNHIECVKYLIEKGAHVCKDLESKEHLPIFSATIADNPEIIDLLIQNGAQINAHSYNKRLPIHTAARYGKLNALKYLVEHGADIDNNWMVMGQTPLFFAISNNNLDCVEYLLSKGANIEATDSTKRTPLMYAMCNLNNKLAEIILRHGANVNAIGLDNRTPPIFAALNDNYEGLKMLVQHKCNLDIVSNRGETALILGVIRGNIEIIRLLLENGANPNIKNQSGNTAISISKTDEITKILICGGADPNVHDKKGISPLITAIKNSNDSLVQFLLAHGADPNFGDIKQNTPLLYAISLNDAVSTLFLLQNGADPNMENADHISPIKLCITQRNLNTIKLLCQYGAIVDESCINFAKENQYDAAINYFSSL